MNLKDLFIAAAGAILAWATPSYATYITIGITGIVDSVEDGGPGDGYLDGLINVGDSITGYYTYDTDTPDTNPLSYGGTYNYYSSPAGIFLNIESFSFRTDLNNVNFLIEITNNYPPNDDYLVRSYNNLPLSNGSTVGRISWWLSDPDGSALSSTELPATAPYLSDWQINRLMIETDREYLIDGHVTSAEIIPEPMSLLLFVVGGLALTRRRR